MKTGLRILLAATGLLLGAGEARPDDERQAKFLLSWGHQGNQPGEFHSPIGIAVSPKDEILVTDVNNARVQRFTTEGTFLGGFDLPHDEPKRTSAQLGGIAIDDLGRIYLSFMLQHRIAVYSEAGAMLREWGKKGGGQGEFNQPGGILLTPDGTLFVADQCNHRVQKFTRDGMFLGTWGGHGDKPGQFGGPDALGSRFAGPHFIARDGKGRLYTTEGILGRVQQLSDDGTPLGSWGDKGSEPGGFGSYKMPNLGSTFGPIGVFADRRDRIWVSSLNDRVQAFTPEGKFILGIGGSGTGPGQFLRPHGMAIDRQGRLYVADAGNQRIQKFEIPDP